MSFTSDHYLSSSYRKVFGDAPRSARYGGVSTGRPASAMTGGFKVSRSSVSSSMASSYRRPSSRGFSSDTVDLSQASSANNEFKIIRTNEKEQLQGLNDRFAMFIEKVHSLEQQNRQLEAELSSLRQRHAEPSRLGQLYQQELKELRAQLEELSSDKARALLERDNLEDEILRLKERCEDEARARQETEQALKAHRKDVDDATLARLELEKKVESLLDEISFLRRAHEEEVAELLEALQAAQTSVDEVEVAKPDLTSALKDIRCQYESLAAKNLQSAEEWYKSKYVNLSEQASRSSEAIRASREELNEYRRQLQARNIDIESLRGTNESLERQLHEAEERNSAEVAGLQVRLGEE